MNRASDLTGNYANPPPLYFNNDIADEDAGKVALQYTFPTQTTVGGVFESLHRYVPDYLEFQNERQRTDYWLDATQHISVYTDWALLLNGPAAPSPTIATTPPTPPAMKAPTRIAGPVGTRRRSRSACAINSEARRRV